MSRSLLRRWVLRLLTPSAPRRRPPAFRPLLESLEDRLTPSALAFTQQASLATGTGPIASAVGDLNGDGKLDLVVANRGSNTVSVYLNTTAAGATSASFAAPVTFSVGAAPSAVALGDFNGDGRPDIAVANRTDSTVSVLVNGTTAGAGAPAFAAQQTFALPSKANPDAIAAADLNGDGKVDLVVGNLNGFNGSVSVLLNTAAAASAAASFAPQQSFAVAASVEGVALGDLNGDGKVDVVTANGGLGGNGTTVSVLLNQTTAGATTASFASQQSFTVGTGPDGAAVADFNGDGKADLAVANAADNTVSVLLNIAADGASAASFASPKTFAVGAGPSSVAAGDFDGDGRPDLAVTDGGGDAVSVLADVTAAGASVPAFAGQQTFATGGDPTSAVVGDFSGDGAADIAAVAFNGGDVNVFLNTSANVTVTTPVVVGYVPGTGAGQGLVEFDRQTGTWASLNPGNPVAITLLASDALGDIAVDYKGYGIYRYRPTTGAFTLLNGTDAVAVTMDGRGDVFASFNGAGVAVFRPDGTAARLTPSTAQALAVDAYGDVVGSFQSFAAQSATPAGMGLYRYAPSNGAFTQLNGSVPLALAVDAQGDVFASFNGAGVGEFRPDGSSRLLTPSAAQLLAVDAYGDLAASFQGFQGPGQVGSGAGLYRLLASGTTFSQLNGNAATALVVDADGDVFASLAGVDTAEFQFTGAGTILGTTTAATLLSADPFGPPFAPL